MSHTEPARLTTSHGAYPERYDWPAARVVPAARMVGTVQLACTRRSEDGRPLPPFYAVAVLGFRKRSLRVRAITGSGTGLISMRLVLSIAELEKLGIPRRR